MKQLIFDPSKKTSRMDIVCFISGSGTNYREIVRAGPEQHYLVFTNRPGCPGLEIARGNQHEIIELSQAPFFREALTKYGTGKVPRNCPERTAYEQEVIKLIEGKLGRPPDLICMAGYDQWTSDWFVQRYYPRILNVHPGDTTQGYDGLHWIPAAKAILAGEKVLRSTLFLVDTSMDRGPVLVQSAEIDVFQTPGGSETPALSGLTGNLNRILRFAQENGINSLPEFKAKAGEELYKILQSECSLLQDRVKTQGDWKIYPFAVHQLIACGRVAVENRIVYLDGEPLPEFGYRMEKQR